MAPAKIKLKSSSLIKLENKNEITETNMNKLTFNSKINQDNPYRHIFSNDFFSVKQKVSGTYKSRIL